MRNIHTVLDLPVVQAKHGHQASTAEGVLSKGFTHRGAPAVLFTCARTCAALRQSWCNTGCRLHIKAIPLNGLH